MRNGLTFATSAVQCLPVFVWRNLCPCFRLCFRRIQEKVLWLHRCCRNISSVDPWRRRWWLRELECIHGALTPLRFEHAHCHDRFGVSTMSSLRYAWVSSITRNTHGAKQCLAPAMYHALIWGELGLHVWNWNHKVVPIELLSWWPNVKCGLQTRGLTDSTGNEKCSDPCRHRTYN